MEGHIVPRTSTRVYLFFTYPCKFKPILEIFNKIYSKRSKAGTLTNRLSVGHPSCKCGIGLTIGKKLDGPIKWWGDLRDQGFSFSSKEGVSWDRSMSPEGQMPEGNIDSVEGHSQFYEGRTFLGQGKPQGNSWVVHPKFYVASLISCTRSTVFVKLTTYSRCLHIVFKIGRLHWNYTFPFFFQVGYKI